jgi:hypothetical protein
VSFTPKIDFDSECRIELCRAELEGIGERKELKDDRSKSAVE